MLSTWHNAWYTVTTQYMLTAIIIIFMVIMIGLQNLVHSTNNMGEGRNSTQNIILKITVCAQNLRHRHAKRYFVYSEQGRITQEKLVLGAQVLNLTGSSGLKYYVKIG